MYKSACSMLLMFLCVANANASDVFVCSVNDESVQFEIDAVTYWPGSFYPDRFAPLYGNGSVNFQSGEQSVKLDFSLTRSNLFQVWHNEEELKLLFHDETSFKYDKVYGDDVTLQIATKSEAGKNYESSYILQLKQFGLNTGLVFEGEVAWEKSFRYHE